LDSYIPWVIIIIGFLTLLAVLWARIRWITKQGAGSKIVYVPPYGYKLIEVKPATAPETQPIRWIPEETG
jgi:hypothetical protein